MNPKTATKVVGQGLLPAKHTTLPAPVFHDPKHGIKLYQGDSLELLGAIPAESVDLIFADPPYFLSNGGISCHAGRMVSVNKGKWDKSQGPEANHEFNRAWLELCQRVLKPNGSIFVSGTAHVIHSIGFAMQQLGYKLLNDIQWVKPNPPPNLSCRYFTHATETIIWAAKNKKSKHTFNYKLMKEMNGGKQMKSVWTIKPPEKAEKRYGKHPTQKPLALLERLIDAASNEGDLVLDPFCGSGTTAIAAVRIRRGVVAAEMDVEFAALALKRIAGELVFVCVAVSSFKAALDLFPRSVDRSGKEYPAGGKSTLATLVHEEKRFFFVGEESRQVVYTVTASSMDEAWERFRKSARARVAIFSVIKTQTEIYLAQ